MARKKQEKKEVNEEVKSLPVVVDSSKKDLAVIKDTKKELSVKISDVSLPTLSKNEEVKTSVEENNTNVSTTQIQNVKIDEFDYKNKAEALLFSAGRKLEFDFIFQNINCKDKNALKNALISLKNDYDNRNSSLMITEDNNAWKIVVREKYVSIARKVNSEMELSKTIMETLAVIAWKSPILQSEVIRIRTNKAYDHIEELIASGFVTKEKRGRSFILKITQKFFDYFDVEGKDDIRQVFSKIKEAPGQKKVDEFKANNVEVNSPQKTLGDLKVIDTTPDTSRSIKHAEEDMDKKRYGALEVYDEGELKSDKNDKFDFDKDDNDSSDEANEIKNEKEISEEEKLEKKTKDLVKQLLEDNK